MITTEACLTLHASVNETLFEEAKTALQLAGCTVEGSHTTRMVRGALIRWATITLPSGSKLVQAHAEDPSIYYHLDIPQHDAFLRVLYDVRSYGVLDLTSPLILVVLTRANPLGSSSTNEVQRF